MHAAHCPATLNAESLGGKEAFPTTARLRPRADQLLWGKPLWHSLECDGYKRVDDRWQEFSGRTCAVREGGRPELPLSAWVKLMTTPTLTKKKKKILDVFGLPARLLSGLRGIWAEVCSPHGQSQWPETWHVLSCAFFCNVNFVERAFLVI